MKNRRMRNVPYAAITLSGTANTKNRRMFLIDSQNTASFAVRMPCQPNQSMCMSND